MVWYPTHSHYLHTEPTSPYPILIMLSASLERDRCQFLSHWFDSPGFWTHRFESHGLKPAFYRFGHCTWYCPRWSDIGKCLPYAPIIPIVSARLLCHSWVIIRSIVAADLKYFTTPDKLVKEVMHYWFCGQFGFVIADPCDLCNF